MNLEAEAHNLAANLNCRISASPYDVAWLARVPSENGHRGARWPDLIDWLLDHQWPDGSWGSRICYYHDRILCTLATLIAFQEHGLDKDIGLAIQRGERFIWKNMHFLNHDLIELVGFELILPTLLAQARTLGLDVPSHSFGYGAIRAAKLRLLPRSMIYEPGTSVAFSLEFLGTHGDPTQLYDVLAPNGAIACSPAATAYLLLQAGERNPKAIQYLEQVRAMPDGVPHFYPFSIFEAAWVLEHLAYAGLPLDHEPLSQLPIWNTLEATLAPDGICMDPGFGIKDGDTTAVVLHVLALNGRSVDPQILSHFEDPQTRAFRTFRFERNASVSTNAHALGALAMLSEYPERQEVWNRLVTMLLAARHYQSYWTDKWHASPYYVTSHVLITLMEANEPMFAECLPSIEWLVHMQRTDGAWGYFQESTVEETAYALLALLHYQRKFGGLDTEALHRGAAYLFQKGLAPAGDRYPDLWIAKALFAPNDIVKSAVLAALILYEDVFGVSSLG